MVDKESPWADHVLCPQGYLAAHHNASQWVGCQLLRGYPDVIEARFGQQTTAGER